MGENKHTRKGADAKPNLHQTQNTPWDPKNQKIAFFQQKTTFEKKMVGANPTPTKICILHQHQKHQPKIPTKTCRNHFQQPQQKHAKSIFPKNASKEPILHWYQWQVHKVPSRPMLLLWNLASLVPKPIQQLILDHPGSRGFSDGWFILRNQCQWCWCCLKIFVFSWLVHWMFA